MLPDRVSNPRPLTYESSALPIALRGPAFVGAGFAGCVFLNIFLLFIISVFSLSFSTFEKAYWLTGDGH